MTDRDRTPWYRMPVGGREARTESPTDEKKKIGTRKRTIEMLDEIRDLGAQTAEVWEDL